MTENVKIGVRVDIIGKNLQGTVAYIGSTMFAPGKWIGVVLDVPKGKNSGTVQGKKYFSCSENCGVFVRPQHIAVIGQTGHADQPQSGLLKSSKAKPRRRSSIKPPVSESKVARIPSPSQLPTPNSQSTKTVPGSSDQNVSHTPAHHSDQRPKPAPPAATQQSDCGDTTGIISERQPHTERGLLSSVSALSGGVSMAEVESLKAQVKDWKDKFETIRLKRQSDRERLKDLEKMRLQLQQLSDYKTRMSEQNQDLLKQLRDAKKEAKEAVESREKYMEEMSDVNETVEMATLDKEMAEEKVETLQQEIESLKERVEELQTDLEIMKAEIEDKGTDGAASSYQLKQLEEQNSRLKEALLRMRDLSSAEKTEHQALEKAMEKKEKDLDDALKKNTKLAEELEKAEATIDELKEQVDAALVAEEMVEQLTEQNLQLEEKVTDYEEQIHDLETINEMNEELQENARENEMELREGVDFARSRAKEAERKAEAANEVVGDYQDTIKKFRRLVQELQDANQELRQSIKHQEGDDKTTDNAESATPPPAFSYQIKMFETKAAARSIDLDLRKLDAKQANQHAQYLSLFMPGLFNRHGGDRDCVQVLLLVQRMSKKAEIVAKHVTDRFDVSIPLQKSSDLRGVRGEQLTFASLLIYTLHCLQTLLEKYDLSLRQCPVELLQKIGTLFVEMSPHEHGLDYLTEQLRRDALDETTNIDNLDKALQFFQHLFHVHLLKEHPVDCWRILDNHIKIANILVQGIRINTVRLKSFLKDGLETSDIALLLRDVEMASSDIKEFYKKLRRRMPQMPSAELGPVPEEALPMLNINSDVVKRINDSESDLHKVFSILNSAVVQTSLSSGPVTDNAPLSYRDLQAIYAKASLNAYSGEMNGYEGVRLSVGNVMATMNSLVMSLQEGEFDTKEKRSKIVPTVEKRAAAVKAEITDSEGLATKIEDKDIAIQELKKSLKLKASEIGEAKIRMGMLERKLQKSGKEGEEVLSRLQQENDNLKEELKKKEREYDITLDTLQSDIDNLEYEKAELKQRLIAQSKRSILDLKSEQTRTTSPTSKISSILAGAPSITGSPQGVQVIVEDSPLLQEQIQALQVALCAKRAENYKLMGKDLANRLKKLAPLNIPQQAKIDKNDKRAADMKKLLVSIEKLKERVMILACPTVVDISKRKPGVIPVGSKSPVKQLAQEQIRLQIAKEKVKELQAKTYQFLASTQVGASVEGHFTSFPTPAFTKGLKQEETFAVGNITLPSFLQGKYRLVQSKANSSSNQIVLEPVQLLQLHNRIIEMYGLLPA